MRILFLHQNFPAQFLHVATSLQATGTHSLLALTTATNQRPPIIPTQTYTWHPPAQPAAPGLAANYAECTGRGVVVADTLLRLKTEGYTPDLIIGHGGWGETLFVRDIWPDVPILLHAEFFYQAQGADIGFDPETTSANPTRTAYLIRARRVPMLQALADATHAVTPTHWQASTFPAVLRPRIAVIHEGIDTALATPDPTASLSLRRDGVTLHPGQEIVTYVARNLEHYRGFHIFMRTLPAILAARPNARVVIVGGDDVSYGPRPAPGTTWRQHMLAELVGRLDMTRVHFVGRVPHRRFLDLMRVSAAHVYLTYPFVLSWSMLEAMSTGALVIGSRTAPVQEVVEHGRNGILCDFFNVTGIADAVIQALAEPEQFTPLRQAARQTVIDRYDLRTKCLPAWLDLVHRVAAMRGIP